MHKHVWATQSVDNLEKFGWNVIAARSFGPDSRTHDLGITAVKVNRRPVCIKIL